MNMVGTIGRRGADFHCSKRGEIRIAGAGAVRAAAVQSRGPYLEQWDFVDNRLRKLSI